MPSSYVIRPAASLQTRQAIHFRRQMMELHRHVTDQQRMLQTLDQMWCTTVAETEKHLDEARRLLGFNIAMFPRYYYTYKYQVWLAMESLEESEACLSKGEKSMAQVLPLFLQSRMYATHAKQPWKGKLKSLAQKVKRIRKTRGKQFYSL